MGDRIDHVQGSRENLENASVSARKPAGQRPAYPDRCVLPGFRVRYRHGPRNDLRSRRSEVPEIGICRNAQPDIEGIETEAVTEQATDEQAESVATPSPTSKA